MSNISDLNSFARGFLCQTIQIADEFVDNFEIPRNKTCLLPPIIPTNTTKRKTVNKDDSGKFKIGYSGKFDPNWESTN